MDSKEKIELFMKKGVLISPEVIDEIDDNILAELQTEKNLEIIDREKILTIKKRLRPKSDVRILYNYTKAAIFKTL